MLDLLPDLTGRPDWVVVVAVALLVLGTIGVRWVGRGGRNQGDQDEGDAEDDRATPPATDAQTTLVLTKALDLLANEAVESQGARAQVDQLRDALLACSAERDRVAQTLAKAQADLEQCNRECRELAMRALERGGDSGE